MTQPPDPYADTQAAMRTFLDRLVGSRPDDATMAELIVDLGAWSNRLAGDAASEVAQYAGNREDLSSNGRFMVPAWTMSAHNDVCLQAAVRFGRAFMGVGNAAHGGAVSLVFDEVLGRLVGTRTLSKRTAYLTVNYRAVTPLDTDLVLTASFARSEGRKHFVTGRLTSGDTLCAEADALFVELKPGHGLDYLTV